MPAVKDKTKSKSKAKDKAQLKQKAKAKAKASAKSNVVSNIQNKIIIGEMPKKRKASTTKGRKTTKSSPQEQFRQPITNVFQPQVSSFQPPSPFVNTSTRLLELQPNLNVLTERVNRLESSSLIRPQAPEPNAPIVQGQVILPEAEPIPPSPIDYYNSAAYNKSNDDLVNDSVVDYWNEVDARAAKAQRQLLQDEFAFQSNRERIPKIPKKVEPPLIPPETYKEPIKSEPMENPEELVAGLTTPPPAPVKKSRKTDEQKLETKLRQEVRTARDRFQNANSRFEINSKFGGASNYDIRRRDEAEKNLAEAEKNLEDFYNSKSSS